MVVQEYSSRLVKSVQSLRSNQELAKSVYLGEISPEEFAVMDAKDMQSAALRAFFDEKKKEAMAQRQTDIIQQHKRLVRKDLGIGGGEFKVGLHTVLREHPIPQSDCLVVIFAKFACCLAVFQVREYGNRLLSTTNTFSR